MSNPKYSHSMLHVLDKLVGSILSKILDLYNIGDIYE